MKESLIDVWVGEKVFTRTDLTRKKQSRIDFVFVSNEIEMRKKETVIVTFCDYQMLKVELSYSKSHARGKGVERGENDGEEVDRRIL